MFEHILMSFASIKPSSLKILPRVSRDHPAMGAAASWLPGNLESFSSSPSDVPKALRPFLQLRLDPRI